MWLPPMSGVILMPAPLLLARTLLSAHTPRLCSRNFRRARPGPALSVLVMSACRWRLSSATRGFSVVGIDLDKHKCDAINAGTSYIADVPSSAVAALVDAGRLRAVPDLAAADSLDTINICVPTPLRKTRDPDMTYVLSAAQLVKEHLRPGMLVILESTTYPGTTEEVVRSILEETGLRAGFDFFLAYSPERVDPGNVKWNTKNVPKVVGGLTPDCSALAAELYGASIDRWSRSVRHAQPRWSSCWRIRFARSTSDLSTKWR